MKSLLLLQISGKESGFQQRSIVRNKARDEKTCPTEGAVLNLFSAHIVQVIHMWDSLSQGSPCGARIQCEGWRLNVPFLQEPALMCLIPSIKGVHVADSAQIPSSSHNCNMGYPFLSTKCPNQLSCD